MKKRILLTLVLAILAVAVVVALPGCNFGDGGFGDILDIFTDNGSDVEIVLTEDEIHLGTAGTAATYQLTPSLSDGSEANFAYKITDTVGMKYVSVTSGGLLTAKAETPKAVTVRISVKGRNISKDILVYVEKIGAKSVSLDSKSVILQLGEGGYKIYTILEPSNATCNLMFKSKNGKVCTVDDFGQITAVGAGKTEVTVYTTDTESGEEISATMEVVVKYAPLDYTVEILTGKDSLKQFDDDLKEIRATLVVNSDYCDQNPTIKWYCNDEELTAFANQKTISYTPDGLVIGKNMPLYARITDSDGNVLNTYDRQKLAVAVYTELTSIDVSIPTGSENTYSQGDVVTATVGFDSSEYPADQYEWYMTKDGGAETYIGSSATNTFSYELKNHGNIVLYCLPIVKGEAKPALKASVSLGSVAEILVDGCEIYNVYIEGGEYTPGNYLPVVYWDSVARPGAELRVVINVEGSDTLMNSNDINYKDYFTQYGCFIPASIVPDFNTSFKVTVSTDGHQSANPAFYTAGTITSGKYKYLDEIIPGTGMNGYISNMEEFGKLLNYISLFRPADIYLTAGNNTVTGMEGYTFEAFFTFSYSDLNKTVYPVMSEPNPSDSPEIRDLHCLVSAAFNCYCDSASFSYGRTMSNHMAGLTFSFGSELFTPIQVADTYNLTEVYADQSYATGAEVRSSDTLPIDSVPHTMSVTTSNQLYYALTLGYRPIPTLDSAAETLYAEMRAVLKRICSDSFTEAQKVHAIYDFLSTEVTYDYSTLDVTIDQGKSEAFCLEGVFLRHRSVCDGIAKSFNSLCRMEGITAIKLSGFETKNGVGHAWNKVLVDGKWYGMDATWGSSRSGSVEIQNHYYLMTTDAVLDQQHETYGNTPITEVQANDAFFKTEIAVGVDHIVDSAAEATSIGTKYFLPRLVNKGDSVSFECKIGNLMSIDDVTTSISNALASVSRAITRTILGADTYIITVTRTN